MAGRQKNVGGAVEGVLLCRLLLVLNVVVVSKGESLLSLNGQWTVQSENGSIRVPANVPGGIYTDLQRNGIIQDPYFKFNDVYYRWIAQKNWTYSRNFTVYQEILQYGTINLVCDGLDTVSSIYINNEQIGVSVDMFIKYVYNIKPYLKLGPNVIAIRFESPIRYAKQQFDIHLWQKYVVPPVCPPPEQKGECHPNFIRKIQSQFSWDWGPAFPSMGIWKNISIEAFNSSVIRDMTVITENSNAWQVTLQMHLETGFNQQKPMQLEVLLDDKQAMLQAVTVVPNGERLAIVNTTFNIPQTLSIQSWWPNGMGNQTLYNLTVVLIDQQTQEAIGKSVFIGFRTVELVQDPIPNATGLTFYFKINGIPVFLKGSNWIPSDSFPERITPEYEKVLLQSARDAHMNVLRVWGGGMYESETFYKLADELGIMIWHDMMFACAMYPATDPFLALVKEEITYQILRLQHHPSILAWAANNENEVALAQNWYQTNLRYSNYKNDYIELYIDTIRPIITSLDPSRPFLSSSPSNGVETEQEGWLAKDPQSSLYGDVHYYNYLNDSWDWTKYPRPRFASEYGFQSWPSFETLSLVSTPVDWYYTSPFMIDRQHHPLGNTEMLYQILLHMNSPVAVALIAISATSLQNFKDLLYLTQINQAMTVKTETECYLRGQSELIGNEGITMGALYWQLNDIWQGPSWSSIEYGGKWKMLHYYAKNFFAPHLVSPYEDKGSLVVYSVSDGSLPTVEVLLIVAVYQWDKLTPIYTLNSTFVQPPTLAQKVYTTDINTLLKDASCPGRQYCFVYVTIINIATNDVLSTNFLFLTYPKDAEGLDSPSIQINVSKQVDTGSDPSSAMTFDLVVTTDSVALFVWLEAEGIPGQFSDNGFVMVNASKRIQFFSRQTLTVEYLVSKLQARSLMNIYDEEPEVFKLLED